MRKTETISRLRIRARQGEDDGEDREELKRPWGVLVRTASPSWLACSQGMKRRGMGDLEIR